MDETPRPVDVVALNCAAAFIRRLNTVRLKWHLCSLENCYVNVQSNIYRLGVNQVDEQSEMDACVRSTRL